MRYIVDPPRIPHGTKSEASFGFPMEQKAKHPLASPWNKKRSILWLPHGIKSEASFGFPMLKGEKAKHPLVSPF